MWEKTDIKEAGYKDSNVSEFIEILEKNKLATHNVILAKGDKIFYEAYWKPFHRDFLHRMYSVTKSVVSLAVGFAKQDGLIDLNEKMSDCFSEYITDETPEYLKNQTVCDMLKMSTTRQIPNWFTSHTDDRVAFYFAKAGDFEHPSGTIYDYDSNGSFVLGALVEKVTNEPLMDYLRRKLFDKIGVSREAHMLECPGGHSWGDSALLCTPRDMLKIASFTMNLGEFNGEQLLDRDYLIQAVSKQVDNNTDGIFEFDRFGYGYQIWKTYGDAFFFNGMGCQLAVCVPHKDLILIYNGDNQGMPLAKSIVIDNFFRIFVDGKTYGTEENSDKLTASLKLLSMWGEKHSAFEKEIDGKEYILNKNPMGITKIKFTFSDDGGKMYYTNKQGDKCLEFGLCENVFTKFPQKGYSKLVGGKPCENHLYNCANSAAWAEEKKLVIKSQIIDDYFGNLTVTVGFKSNEIGIRMIKNAENFLNEYEGYAGGKIKSHQ